VGILDALTPEQVMHCNTVEECALLASMLPPVEAALLDWAINLMADVVEHENCNKMNARNIAMVFAPNMTQVIRNAFLCLFRSQQNHTNPVVSLSDGRSINRPDTCSSGDEFPQDFNRKNFKGKKSGNWSS
jgi:hypothetical protein